MSSGRFVKPITPNDPSVFSPPKSEVDSFKRQNFSPSPLGLGQNKDLPQSPPELSEDGNPYPMDQAHFELRHSQMIPIQKEAADLESQMSSRSNRILSADLKSAAKASEPSAPLPYPEASVKAEEIFGEHEIKLVQDKQREVLMAWIKMWIVMLIIFDLLTLGDRKDNLLHGLEILAANITHACTVALVLSFCFLRKNPHGTRVCISIIAVRYFAVFFRLWVEVYQGSEPKDLTDCVKLAVGAYRFNVLLMLHFLNLIFLYRTTEAGWDRWLTIGGILAITFGFVFAQYSILLSRVLAESGRHFAQIIMLNTVLLGVIISTLYMSNKLSIFQLKLIKEQKKETRLFNRMVDSIKDAMVVVQDSAIAFRNHQAQEVIRDIDDALLYKPIFHVFSQNTFSFERSSSTNMGQPSYRQNSSFHSTRAYSIHDIVQKKVGLLSSTVFTLRPEFANCASMDKMNEILASIEKEQPATATKQFNFFLINLFFLEQEGDSDTPEAVVQLIDISEKILVDSLNSERKYMAYMNSTVSHEMRNPLNSISSQIQLLQSLFSDLSELKHGLSPAKTEALDGLASQSLESMQTCLSSCRILTFTVEDILALPQLKEGKFTKNIQQISLASATQEIINILELQAKSKSVQVKFKLSGFLSEEEPREQTTARVPLDEKRFQQVLLNYVSNALKFTKKRHGKICIVLQKVEPGSEAQEGEAFLRQKVEDFYGFDMLAASSERDFLVDNFQVVSKDQKKPCSPYKLLEPSETPKVVLTVLDNGIGIKDEDKSKLFKLFGCLKSTRSMNTQGIGLGLVITKMITEEFGGETKVFSQFEVGAAFQSSFELVELGESRLKPPSAQDVTSQPSYKQLFHEEKLLQIKRCKDNIRTFSDESFEYSTKKILIVDDEPFNCQALISIFQVLKLDNITEVVDVALSGEEALDLVKENIRDEGDRPKVSYLNKDVEDPKAIFSDQHSDAESNQMKVSKPSSRLIAPRPGGRLVCDYSLILTDCSMPFMDGYEFSTLAIEAFEQFGIEEGERPAIMAVTGHVESEFQKKAVRAGIKQVYSKPISVEAVARLLLEHRMKFKIPASLSKELSSEP